MTHQNQDNTAHTKAMNLYPLALAISEREQARSKRQADIESAYLKTGRYFAFPGHDVDRKPPLENIEDLVALPCEELTGGGRIFSALYSLFYLHHPLVLMEKDTDEVRAVFHPEHFLADVVKYVRRSHERHVKPMLAVFNPTDGAHKSPAGQLSAQGIFDHPVFRHPDLTACEGGISSVISQATLNLLNRADSNVFLNQISCQSVVAALAWFNTDAPTKGDLPESTRCALAALFQVALSIRFDDTSHIANGSVDALFASHDKDGNKLLNTHVYVLLEGAHDLISTNPLYAALRSQVKAALVKLCTLSENNEAVFNCLIYILTWIYADTRSMTIAHKLGMVPPSLFKKISHALNIQCFIRDNAELFTDEAPDARTGKPLAHMTLQDVGVILSNGALSEPQNEQVQLFAKTIISCLRVILNQDRYRVL